MSGFGFRIPKLIKLDRTEPIQPKIKPSIKKNIKKKNFTNPTSLPNSSHPVNLFFFFYFQECHNFLTSNPVRLIKMHAS